MILTGKCLEAFKNWCNTESISYIDILGLEAYLNALIIEFFYSVEIYASTYICHDNTFDFSINNVTYNSFTNSRQEATTQAIKKANEIYNNKC